MTLCTFDHAGAFAENQDTARSLRLGTIVPALDRGEQIVLDFEGVDAATQSFIHALLSDVLRKYGAGVLDRIEFKACNIKVRKIVEIVTEYVQEGLEIERDGL